MALETLKDVKEIDGFEVLQRDSIMAIECKQEHIHIGHDDNMICFRIQSKPIKEVGVNGCQVDTLIETAKLIIQGLHEKYPCRENALAITKLEESLHWLDARKKNRVQRNVEGTSQK